MSRSGAFASALLGVSRVALAGFAFAGSDAEAPAVTTDAAPSASPRKSEPAALPA